MSTVPPSTGLFGLQVPVQVTPKSTRPDLCTYNLRSRSDAYQKSWYSDLLWWILHSSRFIVRNSWGCKSRVLLFLFVFYRTFLGRSLHPLFVHYSQALRSMSVPKLLISLTSRHSSFSCRLFNTVNRFTQRLLELFSLTPTHHPHSRTVRPQILTYPPLFTFVPLIKVPLHLSVKRFLF